MFSINLGVSMIIPLLPVYAESLGASGFLIGTIFAASPFVRGIMMATFGSIADRKEKKQILLLGLSGNIVASIGFVFVLDAVQLLVLRILQGIFSAMVIPVARAYAGELAPKKQQGEVMGLATAGFFAGFAAGPLVGGILADAFGIVAPFIAMGGLAGLALMMVYRAVPRQPPRTRETVGAPSEWAQIVAIFRNDIIKGLFLMRGSVAMGRGIFSALLPLFAQFVLGLTSTHVGFVITLRALLSSVLQPRFGQLADHYNRKWLAVAGFALAPFAFFLLPWASNLSHLIILSAVLGVSTGMAVPSLTSMTVDRGRVYGMGRLMGLEGMFQSFALALGSIVGGSALDIVGYQNAYLGAAFISAVGLLIALWYLRSYSDTYIPYETP